MRKKTYRLFLFRIWYSIANSNKQQRVAIQELLTTCWSVTVAMGNWDRVGITSRFTWEQTSFNQFKCSEPIISSSVCNSSTVMGYHQAMWPHHTGCTAAYRCTYTTIMQIMLHFWICRISLFCIIRRCHIQLNKASYSTTGRITQSITTGDCSYAALLLWWKSLASQQPMHPSKCEYLYTLCVLLCSFSM